MGKILGAVYTLSFLFHVYSLYYNFTFVNFPGENVLTFEGYPGKFKYMTIWNYIFDVFYLGLVAVFLLRGGGGRDGGDGLKGVIDVLHASLFFPLGLLVCTLYWGMSALDAESVSTEAMRDIQPEWNNHAMHSLPFLFAVFDAVVIKHEYPTNGKGLSVVFFFVFCYLSTVLYLGLGPAHVWAYPVLAKLSKNVNELATFLMGCSLMFIFEYFAGKALTTVVWRRHLHCD